MADKMHEWITTGAAPLPPFVRSFAASASGSSSDDDGDDDDTDDDDEDDADDDDADKTEEELRAELKRTKAAIKLANDQSARRRRQVREARRDAEEARKPKPKADGDGDGPDLDTVRHEARSEGEKAGLARAKKAEAKSSLLAAGINPERVAKAVGLLELDDLDLDDDGLDGIDEAIEDLRRTVPELFAKKRKARESVAGGSDRDGERRGPARSTKTASERAAEQILRRG